MKKFLLSFSVIIAFIVYSYHLRTEDSEEVKIIPPGSLKNSNGQNPNTVTQDQIVNPANMRTQMMTKIPKYKNGEYTGDVADAFYGNVQVKATIQNGKISDVQFLQYPNDRQTSLRISNEAMPFLKSEAIQVQNSQVDIVSGATQTSEAFRVSLKSALDKAK